MDKHECPRTENQWRDIYRWDGQWFLTDHEYPPEPIVCCPYCGVRLIAMTDRDAVSLEGASWAAEQVRP